MPRPKNAVSDLSIDEAAMVDDGDNPEAKIVLFKSQDAGAKEMMGWAPRTTSERLAQRRFMEEFWEVRCAYTDSVSDILYSVPASEMGKLLEQTTAEFEAEVEKLLDGVAKAAPGLAKAGRQLVADAVEAAATGDPENITKALEAFGAAPQDKEDTMPAPSTKNNPATETPKQAKSLDDVLAALPEEQRAIVKAKMDADAAALEEAKASKPAADDGDVKAKLADAENRTKALEAEVAQMRDEKATEGFRAKARDIGVGDVEEITTLLKGAFGRSKEEGDLLEKNLRAMAAQAKKGGALLKVVGSDSSEGAPTESDPLAAKAREIQAAEKIGFSDAYAKAAERFPDLAVASYEGDRAKRTAG